MHTDLLIMVVFHVVFSYLEVVKGCRLVVLQEEEGGIKPLRPNLARPFRKHLLGGKTQIYNNNILYLNVGFS